MIRQGEIKRCQQFFTLIFKGKIFVAQLHRISVVNFEQIYFINLKNIQAT